MVPVMSQRTFSVCRSVVFGRSALIAEVLTIAVLAAGCSASGPARRSEAVANTAQRLQGADGPGSVAVAGTIVNQYTTLTADAASGALSLQVQSAAALNPGGDPLAAGDLLLVVQMQGATIDTSDATLPSWGQVSALGNAGNYELVEVASVAGNQLTLACGLKNAYELAGNTQVVRVPQYTTLDVAAGASITAPAWNGTVGGVVALRVQGALTLNGSIDVSGRGFRGGVPDTQSAAAALDVPTYASLANTDGGNKGEGIAGLRAEFGRGAAANGGGGGNSHNAGGGGGANARKAGQAAWSGQGVMSNAVLGNAAWNLDPAGGVGIRANSEGGGRGGYTYGSNDLNALVVGPNQAAWGGNSRRERGGLGGRPLDPSVAGKLFLGGGGGAGDVNNGNPGAGAAGGGLVFVLAGSVAGGVAGAIRADGAQAVNADSTTPPGNANGDAPGGGGGGGTIVLKATTLSTLILSANGGRGGSQIVNNGDESEGPGGGGGGGFLALSGTQTAITATALGSLGGTSSSPAVTEFPSNGATSGNDGVNSASADALALCTVPANTSIPTVEPSPTNDPTGDFGFASTVPGSTFECRVDGAAFAPCPAIYSTAPLADGSHTIDVRAVDPFGFRDATPATYTWLVDQVAPDTSIVTSEPNPTNDPTGDFTFQSNDAAASFECSVDGGAFAACAAAFSTAPLSDGSHTLSVRARDAAGNIDPSPATYTWLLDSSAPDTTIVTREPNPTNDPTGDFTFSSNEASATFQCRVDGSAFAACPASFSTAPLADGAHTLDVRAVDAVGNIDSSPATYTWLVDLVPPDTAIDTKPPSPSADASADFTFTSPEASVTFQCSLDSGAYLACSASFATAPLTAGAHLLSVRAVDAAGNLDPTPASYTWTVQFAVDKDSDGDGISDATELMIGTDPNDADSDDDGVLDGAEPDFASDTDHDGLINALDPDSDNDGILDGTELSVVIPPKATDVSRGHFVADQDPTTSTDPTNPDTDSGGVRDGAEDPNHNGAIDVGERDPNDPKDDVNPPLDSDGDGLTDAEELLLGTDPKDADSDDDGVLDGAEPNPSQDSDGDGLINPLDPDSDNDGILDGTEQGITSASKDTDVARGHFLADADPKTQTSALVWDTDRGSVSDGSEDINRNGRLDASETNPLDPKDDLSVVDSDGDGLSDAFETAIGTNPHDADSDDDGVPDGLEPNPTLDSDGDGLINALDPDSDNDGLFDGTELGFSCSGNGTDLTQAHCIADADLGATRTSPLVADTDRGGIADGAEDQNHNGVVDPGERDPNNAADDQRSGGEAGAGGESGAAGAAEAGAPAGAPGGSGGSGGSSAAAGSGGSIGVSGSGGAARDPSVVVLGGACRFGAPASSSWASGSLLIGLLGALGCRRRRRR
jgi:hypothetical protein